MHLQNHISGSDLGLDYSERNLYFLVYCLYTLIQVMFKVWFGCIFAPTVVSCGGGFFCSLVWILPAIVSAGTGGEGEISESMIQCQ